MKKHNSALRLLIVATASVLCAGLTTTISQAEERGQIGDISPDNPVLEASYPPIPDTFPPNCAGTTCRTPFAAVRQDGCRNNPKIARYCDVIAWRTILPEFYPDIHSVKVTLSWANPDQNDMDLWAWEDDVEEDPQACCFGPAYGSSTTRDQPTETITLGEPEADDPNTDVDEGLYWVTVVNYSTAPTYFNQGYTLKFEWLTLDLGPGFEREEQGGVPRGTGTPATPAGVAPRRTGQGPSTGSTSGDGGPEVSGDEIKVPGTDGELADHELPILTAGSRTERAAGLNPVIPIVIALLVLGGGTAGFFFWRKRRVTEEALEY